MMDFVNFVGQDRDHWLGTLLFILGVCLGLSWIISAVLRKDW